MHVSTDCSVVRMFCSYICFGQVFFILIKEKNSLVEKSKFQEKVMDNSVTTHGFTRF